MAEGKQSQRDDRGEQREPARRDGLAGRLLRAIAPRPREVWVMEPDGRMRRVYKDAQ